MADIIVSTRVINADVLAAALAADSVKVAAFTLRTTQRYGQLLLTNVRGKASGRPGPRAQTGDYRRSINLAIASSGTSVSATVGTNSPQGPRLEFGFNSGVGPQHGVDILGRHFEAPPYAHFGPALDEVGPAYRAAMVAGIAAIVAGRPV